MTTQIWYRVNGVLYNQSQTSYATMMAMDHENYFGGNRKCFKFQKLRR